MKRLLLPVSLILVSLVVFGQSQSQIQISHGTIKVPARTPFFGDKQVEGAESELVLPTPSVAAAISPLERIIGSTTYDLQTNASVGGRIENVDGKIIALWTFSSNDGVSMTFPDRGTGYAYFDGSAWEENPSTRIEDKRVGWPSIVTLANGTEIIVCHNTEIEDLQINSRSTIGSGTWDQDYTTLQSPSPDGNWWPRAIAGGTDGNTLHVISLTQPVDPNNSSDGSIYQGLDGAILYSRSTDGAQSWDSAHVILAGMDSTQYEGFGGDDYDWANSVGDTIAFVTGGGYNDLFIMKSTDNGDNWTKTIVQPFPYQFFDPAHDLLELDTVVNDGTMSVVLDSNGMAHVFFGGYLMSNTDTADGDTISYQPNSGAIYYWNENFGSNLPVIIARPEDGDDSGLIDFNFQPNDNPTLSTGYTVSIASQPSAGIDADGVLYLTYNAAMESYSDGERYYRHIYLMKSTDGGTNWTEPIDLLYPGEDDFTENVFANLAHKVDDYLHIVYQHDFLAGMAVRPDPGNHDVQFNDIIYAKVPIDLNVGMAEHTILNKDFNIYPNPASESVTMNFVMDRTDVVVIEIYDMMGKLVETFSNKSAMGANQLTLDVSHLNSGVYFVNAVAGEQRISKKLVVE